MGVDGLVYGIPYNATRILFFDAKSFVARIKSLRGEDNANMSAREIVNVLMQTCQLAREEFRGEHKWASCVVGHDDGIIYCMPKDNQQVLAIHAKYKMTKLVGRHLPGRFK